MFGSCADPDDQSAIRLYGPSHRSSSVCTVFPVPNPGTAFVTFDNISSWMTSVQIRYTLRLSSEESTERTSTTFARLRAGYMIGRDSVQSEEEAAEEMAEELLARRALELAKPQEMLIAAGAQEEVELRVDSPNTHMYVSVDVVRGRDIDFGVVLLPDSSSSSSGGESADVDPTPLTLFGPCRRAASISANVLVPSSGIVVLGFDNSGTWFSSKTVRFRARVNDADGGGSKCVSGVTDL